jgi:hypothetical protein
LIKAAKLERMAFRRFEVEAGGLPSSCASLRTNERNPEAIGSTDTLRLLFRYHCHEAERQPSAIF